MKNGFKYVTLGILSAALLAQSALAAEWTQFRGPNHDGSTSEKIPAQWPNGLKNVWTAPLNDGFSALTIGGGKVFTLVKQDDPDVAQEVCVALDAKSGKRLWSVPLGVAKYEHGGDSGAPDNAGGDGPRSTPAYDSGKVYTYSSRMVLQCLDANDGKVLWTCNVIKDYAGHNITWENAASPLIDGDTVYIAGGGPGESLLALDKNTGKVIWHTQSERLTHSTPIAATILGQRQIIFYTQSGLVSVLPATGAVLWRFAFRYATSAAISPVVSGNIVYCSAAYGVGSAACRISKTDGGFVATRLWYQPANMLANHWSTPVCYKGFIFALSGQKKFETAPLVCVDMATGRIMWSHEGFGPGGCTLVNGHVLVLSDAGDLVLIKASPNGYVEDARAHVLSGKCWNYPSISDGRIYARSTKEGACLEVPGS